MDVNANEIEKTFSVMQMGVSSYVFSIIGQMTNEIKMLREEVERLQNQVKSLTPDPPLTNK